MVVFFVFVCFCGAGVTAGSLVVLFAFCIVLHTHTLLSHTHTYQPSWFFRFTRLSTPRTGHKGPLVQHTMSEQQPTRRALRTPATLCARGMDTCLPTRHLPPLPGATCTRGMCIQRSPRTCARTHTTAHALPFYPCPRTFVPRAQRLCAT